MKNPSKEEQHIVGIIQDNKDAILSAWKSISGLSKDNDFLAILETSEKDTSILVMARKSGLEVLQERGCQLEHPSMKMLQQPAADPTPGLPALWIVVLHNDIPHVTRMTRQPMNVGSA
jgi:hypothetical protein